MRSRPTSSSVGIRELKNRASSLIRRVRNGETITVTARNHPVARLVPVTAEATHSLEERIRRLVEAGRLAWTGGKPSGAPRPPAVRGRAVADAVVEDRR